MGFEDDIAALPIRPGRIDRGAKARLDVLAAALPYPEFGRGEVRYLRNKDAWVISVIVGRTDWGTGDLVQRVEGALGRPVELLAESRRIYQRICFRIV